MITKKLTSLTEAKLEEALAAKGVEFESGALTKQELIDRLEAADAEPEPVLEPAPEPEPAEELEAAMREAYDRVAKPKRYRVVIHNQEGVDNTPFVKVGVNGRMIQINREEPVVIDESYMEALRHAVVEMPAMPDAPARVTQRFPFSVLGTL